MFYSIHVLLSVLTQTIASGSGWIIWKDCKTNLIDWRFKKCYNLFWSFLGQRCVQVGVRCQSIITMILSSNCCDNDGKSDQSSEVLNNLSNAQINAII